jgi:acetolactate synthase-1/2/3 large subunit
MKQYCDGGEAILEAFRSLGLDYIISSPGSEWSPVWEALARQKVNQQSGPAYIDCWHETLAVDMAMGYTQMTGRMQAVLLHAGAGLLQGSAGMHSAMLAEVPMVLMSGESTSFGEDPQLAIEPQWYRRPQHRRRPAAPRRAGDQMGDPGGECAPLYEHVVRAGEFAQRTPMGPVYLNAPLSDAAAMDAARELASGPAAAQDAAQGGRCRKIAELLIGARNPVILTETAGRDPAAFAALVELADLFAIPVGGRAAFANFPKNHPLHLGTGIRPFLRMPISCCWSAAGPWYPPSRKPTTGTDRRHRREPAKGHDGLSEPAGGPLSRGRDRGPRCALLVEAAKAAGIGRAGTPTGARAGSASTTR